MRKAKQWLLVNWPVVVLVLLSSSIVVTNFRPGTYLLGWDNTVPEVNLWLNLKRIISGVWQEYRGLGTLDGMAHTANIIHWLYIALLSIFLPNNWVRFLFNLLTHLMGGIGVYWLVNQELLPRIAKSSTLQKPHIEKFIGLAVALFYMFNFFTIQMFYLPLELFTIHFALLPWGVWVVLRYLRRGSLRNLWLVLLVNLLGVSQAHVPTIFLSYGLVIGFVLLGYLLEKHQHKWRKALLVILMVFMANAFWGIPYTYSALNKSQEIAQSKQNKQGTRSVFFRNNAWGNLASLSSFGAFRLDYLDWNDNEQKYLPVMGPWVEWYNSKIYQVFSKVLFGLVVLAVFSASKRAIKKKSGLMFGLVVSWLVALMMLGSDVPIFGELAQLLRDSIPLFAQVFRFTFTKFSLVYVFISSLLLAGLLTSLNQSKRLQRMKAWLKWIGLLVIGTFSVLLAWPVWQGYFFYPTLYTKIPPEYYQLQTLLDKDYPQSRIATLPLHTMWGWLANSNQWGYHGSGFLWQMLSQSMVDRSFDAWSKDNETLYKQLSRALYGLDSQAFSSTLKKYHVDLLLLDKSIFHPGNYPEAIFYPEMDIFFSQQESLSLESKLDFLDVINVKTKGRNLSLFTPQQVALVDESYHTDYTTRDQAYLDLGDYFQGAKGIRYPFSYLQQETLNSQAIFHNNDLVFAVDLPDYEVVIPSFKEKQQVVPVEMLVALNNDNLVLALIPQLPIIVAAQQQIKTQPITQTFELEGIEGDIIFKLKNSYFELKVSELSAQPQLVKIINLPIEQNYTLEVYSGRLIEKSEKQTDLELDELLGAVRLDLADRVELLDKQLAKVNSGSFTIYLPTGSNQDFILKLPWSTSPQSDGEANNCNREGLGEVTKTTHQDILTYTATQKGLACDTYFLDLHPEMEYVYWFAGEDFLGSGQKHFLVNPLSKHFDIETITPNGKFNLWYPLYPSGSNVRYNTNSFQLDLTQESFGKEVSRVSLLKAEFLPLPLSWLTSIRLQPEIPLFKFNTQLISEKKIGTYLYLAKVKVETETGLIVLPQSHDKGWVAFTLSIPTRVLTKLKYNGWANSWLLPDGDHRIVIMYWPQLLSFGGYGLLFGTLVWLRRKSKAK